MSDHHDKVIRNATIVMILSAIAAVCNLIFIVLLIFQS